MLNAIVSEIKGRIMRYTYHKRNEFDADLNVIDMLNGLYNIRTDELKPHDPDYLSRNQKPIFCNPNAKPKLFGKFLSEILYLLRSGRY
jgi:phage/plasmid-associated DNA primase